MKKLFFIAAIASAALVSCTKNELAPSVTEQQEISFSSPVVGNTTKASPTPSYGLLTGVYPTGVNFGVWAWYCEDDTYDPTNAEPYMTNVEVGYNSANKNDVETESGAWVPTSPYYWPKNGKLTFNAYSPIEISSYVTCDKTTGLAFTDYVVPTTIASQIDVLYSNRAEDKTSSIGTVGNTYEGVDIVFNHALSAIAFTVKTAADYGNAIALQSITVHADSKGTFNQNIPGTPSWISSVPADYVVAGAVDAAYGASQIVTSSSQAAGTTTLILPQTFDSANQTITVAYYIKNNDEEPLLQTATFDLSLSENQSGNVPDGEDEGTDPDAVTVDRWEMGKKYTYNLTIGLDGIYFSPAINAWDDQTQVNLPQINS